MLQLHKTDDGQQEYAEFSHLPRRRFTDFGMSVASFLFKEIFLSCVVLCLLFN